MNTDYQLKISARASIDHITRKMCEDKGGEYKSKSLDLATEIFLNEIDLQRGKKVAKQWFPISVIIFIVNFVIHRQIAFLLASARISEPHDIRSSGLKPASAVKKPQL